MSHVSHVIALCVVIFSTVHSDNPDQRDVHKQCVRAGYLGACIEFPFRGIYPHRCSNLMCAKAFGNGYYLGDSIGPAMDGTYCGSRKVCFRGQCNQESEQMEAYGIDAEYICVGMPNADRRLPLSL